MAINLQNVYIFQQTRKKTIVITKFMLVHSLQFIPQVLTYK